MTAFLLFMFLLVIALAVSSGLAVDSRDVNVGLFREPDAAPRFAEQTTSFKLHADVAPGASDKSDSVSSARLGAARVKTA